MANNEDRIAVVTRLSRILISAFVVGSISGLSLIGILLYINSGSEMGVLQHVIFVLAVIGSLGVVITSFRITKKIMASRPGAGE